MLPMVGVLKKCKEDEPMLFFKPKKKNNALKIILIVVGSITVFVAGYVVISKLITNSRAKKAEALLDADDCECNEIIFDECDEEDCCECEEAVEA